MTHEPQYPPNDPIPTEPAHGSFPDFRAPNRDARCEPTELPLSEHDKEIYINTYSQKSTNGELASPSDRDETNLILIVEDGSMVARKTALMIQRTGYRARIARTGEEGLRLARLLRPSLVLLDLMLPDIDGFEVCQELRCSRATMRIPIVMVTALEDSMHRRRGFRVGANAYLNKPFTESQLHEAITTAYRWRRQLAETQLVGEIHFELENEVRFLMEINDFLASLFLKTSLSNQQVQHFKQALLEMGQNAIEWGNKYRRDTLVQIEYRIYEERVEVLVRDQGPGFDRNHLPHAASYDDPLSHMEVRERLGLREGGFGLLIARGMVDELRHNDLGNEVTLIKYLPSPDSPSITETVTVTETVTETETAPRRSTTSHAGGSQVTEPTDPSDHAFRQSLWN